MYYGAFSCVIANESKTMLLDKSDTKRVKKYSAHGGTGVYVLWLETKISATSHGPFYDSQVRNTIWLMFQKLFSLCRVYASFCLERNNKGSESMGLLDSKRLRKNN